MLRALLVLLFLTAGCAAAPAAPAPAVGGPDVDFAAMMIPHHQQALELSALVAGRTTDPTVSDLAFRIDREQVEEIGQLQGFLNLRGAPAPAPMGAMAGMAGMADTATLDRLRASSGPAFDRLWLQTMIAHHEGAITMARAYPGGALTEFARTLQQSQQLEIDRMRTALGAV